MNYLFIGGNSDGQEIEVPEHMTVLRVSDKPKSSFSIHDHPFEQIGCSTYTKRMIVVFYIGGKRRECYFASQELSDAKAAKLYLECITR